MGNSINSNVVQLFQVATIVTTGLLAGLFYGYSCSVNQALGNLSDLKYLEAFQSINRVIQNPTFFITFMGSVFLLPIATLITLKQGTSNSFLFMLAASILYIVGVFGITVFFNVPLNEKLNQFNIGSATSSELATMRKIFEKPWNTFHSIRTLASIITFLLTILALTKQK